MVGAECRYGNYSRLLKIWNGAMAGFDTDENALPHFKLTRSLADTVGVVLHTNEDLLALGGYTTRNSSLFFTRSIRTVGIACRIRVRSPPIRGRKALLEWVFRPSVYAM
jgi:hypothetical protein